MSSMDIIGSELIHYEANWLSGIDQENWFNLFKSTDSNGLRFQQFQEFLNGTLYKYLAIFPAATAPKTSQSNSETCHAGQHNNSNHVDTCKFSHQQEMQIFKIFDRNNDHLIDLLEFSAMCQNWLEPTYRPSCGLVVVDVQNDFIDGSLALINGPAGQDGADVVPVINDLIGSCSFRSVVYTQDWHPIDHIGFHSNLHKRKYRLLHKSRPANDGSATEANENNHQSDQERATSRDEQTNCSENQTFKCNKLDPNVRVFDTVVFEDGHVEQKLWPVHCVQESWGAQLHPELKIAQNAIRIYKGTLAHVDAYSAFWDNMRLNETGLRQELVSRNIKDLFFCGLALDYCVAASAIDSARAGFITFVIEDACRGIDGLEIERKRGELIRSGVMIVNSSSVKSYLSGPLDKGLAGPASGLSVEPGQYLDRNTIRAICLKRALLLS